MLALRMLPSRLFKYRGDNDFSEKLVVDGTVWLPTAKDLNDPLECRTGIIPQKFKDEAIRAREQAQMMGLLLTPRYQTAKNLFSLDKRQTKKWLARFAKAPHERKVHLMRKLLRDHGMNLSDPKAMFDNFEAQMASVGIFSLSAVSDDQLMWAHYGDSHSGLVFGFDVADGCNLSNPDHLIEVTYSDEKPVIEKAEGNMRISFSSDEKGQIESNFSFAFNDPLFRACISTKPKAWAYEQEWRYVHESPGAHPFPGKLSSVMFGLRMPADRKSYYSNLLAANGYSVELSQMTQTASGAFEVQSL